MTSVIKLSRTWIDLIVNQPKSLRNLLFLSSGMYKDRFNRE
jgi:hypothetical protein